MTTGLATPALALAAYAEAWVSGAKVVVFGNALSSLAERLVKRGARLVYVYDSDPGRVSEAAALSQLSQVSYAPLSQAGTARRDGVFDVGIVEDLSLGDQDPTDLIQRLSRILSTRGRAIVATRNAQSQGTLLPSAPGKAQDLGYYELYDAVSGAFDEVRMFGQTPFVGYAIADFGAADDPEIQVDTSFLDDGAEQPEWFFAQASHQAEEPGPFCVVQLPLAEVREAEKSARPSTPPPGRKAAPAGQGKRIAQLSRELEQREEWLVAAESRSAAADERADAMQADLDRLAEDCESKDRVIARLRKELTDAQAVSKQASSAKSSYQAKSREHDEHQRQTAQLQSNAAQLELRANQLKGQVSELQRTVGELESTVAELEQKNATDAKRFGRQLERLEQQVAEAKKKARSERERAQEAASEVEQLREQVQSKGNTDELEALQLKLTNESSRADAAVRAASQLEQSGGQLQDKLDEAVARLAASDKKQTALAKALETAERQLKQADQDRVRIAELNASLKAAEERRAAAESRAKEADELTKQAEASTGQNDAMAQELTATEARLRERGQAVLKLQRELESTERLGRELLSELEELRAEAGGLKDENDDSSELRSDNARLSADLEAARWTIEALEGRLNRSETAD